MYIQTWRSLCSTKLYSCTPGCRSVMCFISEISQLARKPCSHGPTSAALCHFSGHPPITPPCLLSISLQTELEAPCPSLVPLSWLLSFTSSSPGLQPAALLLTDAARAQAELLASALRTDAAGYSHRARAPGLLHGHLSATGPPAQRCWLGMGCDRGSLAGSGQQPSAKCFHTA